MVVADGASDSRYSDGFTHQCRCAGGLASLQEMFAGADFDELVITTRQPGRDGHWYANFGNATYHPRHAGKFQLYSDGGTMFAINVKTGKLRTILAEPDGGVRAPQGIVHFGHLQTGP